MSLGISEKTEQIKDLLTIFSKSDFKHDFSKKSLPILNVLGESEPLGISKTTYLKNVIELKTKAGNSTVYDFFKDHYSNILPSNKKLQPLSENEILNFLDINYNTWRKELFDFTEKLSKNELPIKKDVLINKANIKRNYSVSFHPTKIKGKHLNIPHAFKTTANGKNIFVLIIDASFFSMSSIGVEDILKNQYIGKYDPKETYDFYILENIENSADSANKISQFDVQNPNIKIFVLREPPNNIVSYPSFDKSGQESNLFSSIEIISKKGSNNKINSTLKIDSKEYEREDLGSLSQIDRASFLGFQNLILEKFTFTREVMSYFLLKRAGDWCQALSLLDFSRVYEVYEYKNKKLEKTNRVETLNSLQNKASIGLVTHDRILLSYCLVLGINVFYSLKTVAASDSDSDNNSVTWLAYFKNQSSDIYFEDLDEIKKIKPTFIKQIESYKKNISAIEKQAELYVKTLNFSENKKVIENVLIIRLIMILLKNLYIEQYFDAKKNEILKYYDEIESLSKKDVYLMDEEKQKEISNILSCIRSLIRTTNEMDIHNVNLQEIKGYDTQNIEEKILKEYLTLVPRKFKGDEESNFNYLVLDKIKEDYEDLKTKNLHKDLKKKILSFKKEEKNIKRSDIYYNKIVSKIISIFDDSVQEGGDVPNLLKMLQSYKRRRFSETEVKPKYFNDEYGNFYSNHGCYVVMKKHLLILKKGLEKLGTKKLEDYTKDELEFYQRFIIFYLDEIYTKLFTLRGRIKYEKQNAQFEEDLYLDFLRIYYELYFIKEYIENRRPAMDLYKIYFELRNKWGYFLLLGEETRLQRYKKEGLSDFNTISKRLNSIYETVRSIVVGKQKLDKKDNCYTTSITKRKRVSSSSSLKTSTRKRVRTSSSKKSSASSKPRSQTRKRIRVS